MSDKQSALEKRLLELIHSYETFGLSEDARRLSCNLPTRQKTHFDKWVDGFDTAQMTVDLEVKKQARRAKVAENVRRFRAKKKEAL